MFARVTEYRMKPESSEVARELLYSMKDQIMGMPGMHHFVNVMNEDGRGYVVSLVESRETSEENADRVAEIWGQFADHMAAEPKAAGFEVVANWSN